MSAFRITRYASSWGITSKLDSFSDVLNLVDSLTSTEYVVDLLSAKHGLAANVAQQRAKAVCPHVRLAIDYVHQSLDGPPEVSFLPAYYAILNLSKVYVLLGPKHASLPTGHHGVRYLGHDKDSQNLLTEEIRLKTGGAIPLLYETVTGLAIRRDLTLNMGEVYPYVADVGAEYSLASGTPSRLALLLDWSFPADAGGDAIPTVRVRPIEDGHSTTARELKVFRGFRADSTASNIWKGPKIKKGRVATFEVRKYLRPELLYEYSKLDATPLSGSHLLLPEELPIALVFFHLSSVVRYKPEFFEKLRDSRFWPVVGAARRHSLLRSLILFWSFTHKQTLTIEHA